jgi:hypothetical protein
MATYHSLNAAQEGSRISFEEKLGVESSTDRSILRELLLQHFRIPLEMPQNGVVRRRIEGFESKKKLKPGYNVGALMRCP